MNYLVFLDLVCGTQLELLAVCSVREDALAIAGAHLAGAAEIRDISRLALAERRSLFNRASTGGQFSFARGEQIGEPVSTAPDPVTLCALLSVQAAGTVQNNAPQEGV